MTNDRDLWYLQYSDVFAEEYMVDCNCSCPDEWSKKLKEIWNEGLEEQCTRLCSECGNTREVRRVKDVPGKYHCADCRRNQDPQT